MDAETARRVSELAASLKKMHLATTMEEATERAKEIILKTKSEAKDRPIKELFDDVKHSEGQAARAVVADAGAVEKADVTLDKIRKELLHVDNQQKAAGQSLAGDVNKAKSVLADDVAQHGQEVQDVQQLKKDVAKRKQAVDDVKEIVEMADRVQDNAS